MSLIVFTGGARSGKSSAAVQLVGTRARECAVSVVVFGQEGVDAEFAQRIAAHRVGRPANWTTVEARDTSSWMEKVAADHIVLVDCLGTLLGLAMDEATRPTPVATSGELPRAPEEFASAADDRFAAALEWILGREGDTVVVTNEVGDGVVPAFAAGRFFRDTLGRANRVLVQRADAAYLCVAGRLIALHGLPTSAVWPQD